VTHTVAALDACCPLTVVDPAAVGLAPETVASTVSPFAGVRVTCSDHATSHHIRPDDDDDERMNFNVA